jgi:transcriptional regulator with XRE-family HTH domain
MLSSINSTMIKIWKKLARKPYRDAFVGAHISNTVAGQIALLRTERGWTQKELAEKAGMKQSRISALEDPNYENFEVGTLRRIASAFDVALSVRFVSFSSLAERSANICNDLLVPRFDQDTLDQYCPVTSSTGKVQAIGYGASFGAGQNFSFEVPRTFSHAMH